MLPSFAASVVVIDTAASQPHPTIAASDTEGSVDAPLVVLVAVLLVVVGSRSSEAVDCVELLLLVEDGLPLSGFPAVYSQSPYDLPASSLIVGANELA